MGNIPLPVRSLIIYVAAARGLLSQVTDDSAIVVVCPSLIYGLSRS